MTYGRSVRVGAAVAAMVGTIVVIDACTGDDPAVVAPSAVDGGEASVDGGAPLDAADVEPIDAGPLRISALAAGFDVACAIVESKGLSLWCWGSNASRMLDPAGGGGSTCRYGGQDYDCSPTPKMIDPGPISSVALGQSFGCVVKQGVAYCWGDNSAQEVGSSQVSTVACDTLWPFAERKCVPALARVELPADAGSVVEVAASSSSHHACAVTSKKELWCWGFNGHGEVKMPATLQEGPTRVLDGIEHAAAGGQFVGRTCAVDATARVWCWGGVGKVSLLDGGPCNSDNACPPRLVAADGGSLLASDIELGDSNACAVTLDGLRCFGDNRAGQSSPDEGLEDKPSPSPPEIGDAGPLDGPYQLTMGLVTTCLRTPTAVICFGNNTAGQLATLDQAQRKVRLPTRRLLVAGGLTTFALDRPGGGPDVVSAWGANVLGVLGHVPGQPNDVDAGSTFAFVVGNGAFPIPF